MSDESSKLSPEQVGGSVLALHLFIAALLRQQQGNRALLEDVERTLAKVQQDLSVDEGSPYRRQFNATASGLLDVLRGS